MFRLLAQRRDSHGRTLADQHEADEAHQSWPVRERISVETFSPSNPAPTNTARCSPAARNAALEWQESRLVPTPWEHSRHQRRSSWRRSRANEPQLPKPQFKTLPNEVHECIVSQLEALHLQCLEACLSCHLRDLHSLGLVSRAWEKAATGRMYRKVYLLANEEDKRLPKLKTRGTGRLKLLRRTLREQPMLARCVRELHLSDIHRLYREATIDKEEITNMVASLVMACPQLERLVGFHIPYSRHFDRLSHALSTRPHLKEKLWTFQDDVDDHSEDDDDDHAPDTGAHYIAATNETERFLGLNSNHPLLSSLVLHSFEQRTSALNYRATVVTIRNFPALRHLTLSGLAANAFTNMALTALPPQLQSLRLERLPGVNDRGLQRLSTSPLAKSLLRLALIDLDISSLFTISNILSPQFERLKKFSFAQQQAPSVTSKELVPDFHCNTLESLHFEIRGDAGPLTSLLSPSHSTAEPQSFPFADQGPITCAATCVLAESIKKGRFPALRKIRCPQDPQGFIQALCKPLATALLPSDMDQLKPSSRSSSQSSSSMKSSHTQGCGDRLDPQETLEIDRADSAVEMSSQDLSQVVLTPARSRLAAQARVLAARKKPLMTVRVYDPSGDMQIDKNVGGHLGTVRSRITYDLKPDAGRTLAGNAELLDKRNQWMTRVEDIIHLDEFESSREWGSCGHRMSWSWGENAVMLDDLT